MELNKVDLLKLEEGMEKVRNLGRSETLNKKRVRIRWLGAFRSRAYVRKHVVDVDEPYGAAGEDSAPTAIEHALSALGGCLSTGFVLNCTVKGIRIHDMEITLEGDIDNMLTFFRLSDEGHSGYSKVEAKLYVRADADEQKLREIWLDTLRTSPVGNTFSRPVEIVPSLIAM